MDSPGHPRLLLVGCGNMGRAILDAWLGAGSVPRETILVYDPLVDQLPQGVRRCAHPDEVADEDRPGAIVLAVKPQMVDEVAADIRRGHLAGDALLLSVLAGVPLARLEQLFPHARAVRFMANLSAALGLSPVAVYAGGREPTVPDAALLRHVLDPLGPVEQLRAEDELHAVTALAGSGPGFVYRFLDALAQGGAELGLDPATAARMALATVRGAAELAGRSGEGFAALAARVASKGGTTEAGLAVLDRDAALVRLIARTLRAAHDRSQTLAAGG